MRIAAISAMLLFATVVPGADAPPDTGGAASARALPKASGCLGGKLVTFPDKGIADGVRATLGLLESCCDHSLYQADELKAALHGDHVRLAFSKPIRAKVMEKNIKFLELVFRLPLNTGVFWVRTGNQWQRYSKYKPQKEKPFDAWLRQAQAVRGRQTPLYSGQRQVRAHLNGPGAFNEGPVLNSAEFRDRAGHQRCRKTSFGGWRSTSLMARAGMVPEGMKVSTTRQASSPPVSSSVALCLKNRASTS